MKEFATLLYPAITLICSACSVLYIIFIASSTSHEFWHKAFRDIVNAFTGIVLVLDWAINAHIRTVPNLLLMVGWIFMCGYLMVIEPTIVDLKTTHEPPSDVARAKRNLRTLYQIGFGLAMIVLIVSCGNLGTVIASMMGG